MILLKSRLSRLGRIRFTINHYDFLISHENHILTITRSSKQWKWFVTEHEYYLGDNACKDLIETRMKSDSSYSGIKVHSLYEKARTRRSIYGFVPLDNNLYPNPPEKGKIFALLPTDETYNFGMHFQAPWIVDISRGRLSDIENSPWQQEILFYLKDLLFQYCEWISHQVTEYETTKEQIEFLQKALSVLRDVPENRYGCEPSSVEESLKKLYFQNGEQFYPMLFRMIQHSKILLAHKRRGIERTSIAECFWFPTLR